MGNPLAGSRMFEVARQAEVVVGAHIDQLAAIVAHHLRALARSEHALGLVQSLAAQRVQVCLQSGEKRIFRLIAHIVLVCGCRLDRLLQYAVP